MPNSILPQDQDGQVLFNAISSFFCKFEIGNLLRKCNAQKEKGVPVLDIFKYKLCNIFSDRSMYMQQKTGSFRESFSKNTFYRFLSNPKTNWLRFTTLLSRKVADTIETLTDSDRVNVFIVDDSLFERTSCKQTELGSRVFDHTSMKEIIRIYGKRWQIEVFFKTCKSYLQLVTECHSLSFDALTAHVAIVFTRYLMIAMEQRKCEDDRTLGEIFFFFTDELADITFGESFQIIVTAMLESVCAIFQPTEEQMALFIEMFIGRLPEYIRNSLTKASLAA